MRPGIIDARAQRLRNTDLLNYLEVDVRIILKYVLNI